MSRAVEVLEGNQKSLNRLMKIFDKLDNNGDGFLDADEIKEAMKIFGINLTAEEATHFIKSLDGDGNGKLERHEMASFHDQLLDLRRRKSGKFRSVSKEHFEEEESTSVVAWSAVLFVLYLIVGLCYGYYRQGWSCIDSIYFVIATVATVGYGDMSFASSEEDKVFGGFYVFVGVAFIGTAVGIILDHFMALQEKSMRQLQEDASTALGKGESLKFSLSFELRRLRIGVVRNAFNVLALALVGASVITNLESDQHWSFADGFYFACVTMTTVGYGDLTPKSSAGRIFTCCYILVAFSVIARAMSFLASMPMEMRRLRHIDAILHQFGECLDPSALDELCDSSEVKALRSARQIDAAETAPHVTRAEFVLWQLMKQKKVTFHTDIAPCLIIFDQLDQDGSGSIDRADIALHQEKLFGCTTSTPRDGGQRAKAAFKPPVTIPTSYSRSGSKNGVQPPQAAFANTVRAYLPRSDSKLAAPRVRPPREDVVPTRPFVTHPNTTAEPARSRTPGRSSPSVASAGRVTPSRPGGGQPANSSTRPKLAEPLLGFQSRKTRP